MHDVDAPGGRMLHEVLRGATADTHDTLDGLFGSLDLTDRGEYTRFLVAHYLGWRPLHAQFQGFVRDELKVEPVDYPALLAADLAGLDIDAAGLAPASPPEGLDPSAVTYVLAGSRLGIVSIGRQELWGPSRGHPSSYMADTSGLDVWRALVGWMKRQTLDSAREDALTASARAAFGVFRGAFADSAAVAV